MADGQIATRWLGVYSYDQSGSLPESYVDTNFELQLRIGWFGRFRGTILDAEPGILEPATIRGKLTADRITFEKRYVSLWVSDEFGDLSSVPGQQSYSIHYVGKFTENRNRINGFWNIWGDVRWINGNRWELPATSGTCTLQDLTGPPIDFAAGRFCLISGGGLKMVQFNGRTDKFVERPVRKAYTQQNG